MRPGGRLARAPVCFARPSRSTPGVEPPKEGRKPSEPQVGRQKPKKRTNIIRGSALETRRPMGAHKDLQIDPKGPCHMYVGPLGSIWHAAWASFEILRFFCFSKAFTILKIVKILKPAQAPSPVSLRARGKLLRFFRRACRFLRFFKNF